MFIAILNKSTKVADSDVAVMTQAVNWQMKWHVAPAYGKSRPAVVHLSNEQMIPPGSYVIGLFDDSDQPGALGWHTEDQNGNVFGRVFCNPTLTHGFKVLDGPYSITSILSHEVIEAYVDPDVSDWTMANDGTLYAKEACDPVEADIYEIHVRGTIPCSVSNFIFPSWFDPSGQGEFDQLGKLSAPFQMDAGGYYVYLPPGQTNPQQKFGDQMPDWRRETKQSEFARTAKRTIR